MEPAKGSRRSARGRGRGRGRSRSHGRLRGPGAVRTLELSLNELKERLKSKRIDDFRKTTPVEQRPRPNKRKARPVKVPEPEMPLQRIITPSELKKLGFDLSGPSGQVLGVGEEEATATPPSPMQPPVVLTPAMGVITVPDGQEVDQTLFVDASIEWVGFSSTTTFTAELPTLQTLSPGPSTSSSKPEPSSFEEDVEAEALQ